MPSTTGLHLLVDSTGIKMLDEGEWKTKKHGADYRRQWHKVHPGIDAYTLEIRAIEVTDNSIVDAPVRPALLDRIAADERIASVSCDGAYDTKDPTAMRRSLCATRTLSPRPALESKPLQRRCPHRNPAGDKTGGAGNMEEMERLSLAQPCRNQDALLKLLGERVMARDFDRQVAELQVRPVVNRFTRLPPCDDPCVIKRNVNSVSSVFARYA